MVAGNDNGPGDKTTSSSIIAPDLANSGDEKFVKYLHLRSILFVGLGDL